ncbi:hypothetical protein RBSWK_00572 [Rhodopirellula baltica SWK14]|uniref:Uncharacterized protein n=1 Tax=Rhodopirellula baltica SWK14 TaxID=993516 RepID=L7CMC6_RHOBT|nr:hypothetical protein RBSWK_00572 [Rhodopirellula baltica SWK14]
MPHKCEASFSDSATNPDATSCKTLSTSARSEIEISSKVWDDLTGLTRLYRLRHWASGFHGIFRTQLAWKIFHCLKTCHGFSNLCRHSHNNNWLALPTLP